MRNYQLGICHTAVRLSKPELSSQPSTSANWQRLSTKKTSIWSDSGTCSGENRLGLWEGNQLSRIYQRRMVPMKTRP